MLPNILSEEQIGNLNDILTVLECFSIGSVMLSGQRYVTCGVILPLFNYLIKSLSTDTSDSSFKAYFKKQLNKSINFYSDRFDIENKSLLACSFLCPKYKNLKFIAKEKRSEKIENLRKFLKDVHEKYLKKNHLSKSDTIFDMQRDSKKSKLNSYYCTEEINSFENEFEKYLMLDLTSIKVTELKYWLDAKPSFPILSELAGFLLGAPATSVPSECLFSLSGYQCWDRRNRLSPENLEMIVFLYQNYELLW